MSKNIIEKTVKEGSFMDVVLPEFEFMKVKLFHSTYSEKSPKLLKEIKKQENFNIQVYLDNVSSIHFKEIKQNLSDIVSPSYFRYDPSLKCNTYYTGHWTGDTEAKKRQIESIVEYLSDFEKSYKNEFIQETKVFNESVESNDSYLDKNIAVKYHPELKSFVVLSLKFLGPDKYKLLASSSQQTVKLGESEKVDNHFFDDMVKFKEKLLNNMVFIIKPVSYKNIKNYIEEIIDEKAQFIETQKVLSKEYLNNPFSYEKDNILNFKITHNQDTGCFDFYCKGYRRPGSNIYGNSEGRSVLGLYGLNFILSEEVLDKEIKENMSATRIDDEIVADNTYKIDLEETKDSSALNLVVPASSTEKLKKIYDKFLEHEDLLTRPLKNLKLHDTSLMKENLEKEPFVYLSKTGRAYLVFTINDKNIKDKETKNIISSHTILKGVEITYKEAQEYLNTHVWSESILNNSKKINAQISFSINNNVNKYVPDSEVEDLYNKIYLNFKLKNELKASPKVKPLKI